MSSKNLKRWFSRLKEPLDAIYRPWGNIASKRLTEIFRSPIHVDQIEIDLLSHEFRDITFDAQKIDFVIAIPDAKEPWTLRLDSRFVYMMIDRLLGAPESEPMQRELRPESNLLTAIESRVVTYGLEELIHPCLDLWHPDMPIQSPRVNVRPSDRCIVSESVCVKFQVYGSSDTIFHGQWLIPESYIAENFGRLLVQDHEPATLIVTLARSMISKEELDQLEVGDIISTEQLANDSAEVSWNSQALFRGIPGVYQGSKALRLNGFQEPIG
jgi:flagellar motor switch protein FliM